MTPALLAAAPEQVPDMAALFARLMAQLPGLGALSESTLVAVGMLLAAVAVTGVITVFALSAIWFERKISARIQCRLGPMDVTVYGLDEMSRRHWWMPGGLLQTIADGVKLLGKEDLIPADADRPLYILGPIVVFLGVFAMYAVLPFGPYLIGTDLDTGLFFVAAVGSLEAIGIMMSGWASNNKWSLFGTMRAATQVVSYEIPLSLAFVTVIALAGTFSMTELVEAQRGWFVKWYLFANPFTFVAFFLYYIASLAQVKRAPFDLPEAESELVSGFHTEYAGMRFSIFFLAEYAAMYAVSAVASVVFLGGWYTGIGRIPGTEFSVDGWIHDHRTGVLANLVGFAVIFTKSYVLVWLQMVLRWTLPRIRLDQVMHLCLKVLLPFSIICVAGSSLWQLLLGDRFLWFFPKG